MTLIYLRLREAETLFFRQTAREAHIPEERDFESSTVRGERNRRSDELVGGAWGRVRLHHDEVSQALVAKNRELLRLHTCAEEREERDENADEREAFANRSVVWLPTFSPAIPAFSPSAVLFVSRFKLSKIESAWKCASSICGLYVNWSQKFCNTRKARSCHARLGVRPAAPLDLVIPYAADYNNRGNMRIRMLMTATVSVLLTQLAGAQPGGLRVLASNGIKAVVDDLRPQLERELGRLLAIEFGTTASLRQRIDGGETFDVTILTAEAVDALAKSGKIAAASVRPLGRAGVGEACVREPRSPRSARRKI